jgi:hypothetical protein
MALVLGRDEELLAQLRALLTFLPPPASSPAPAPAPVKVESMGTSGGGGRRRRRLGSKRDRDDDDDSEAEAEAEQHGEEPAAAQPHYCPPPCKRTRCVVIKGVFGF